MDAIAPFWDGNETWLVVIGASAVRALSRRSTRCSCRRFYLPVLLLLFGLIFRGVAFEFRYRSDACARTLGLRASSSARRWSPSSRARRSAR